MSLILDALKKSEAERQRGQVPNLLSPLPAHSSPASAEKKSKLPWLIVLALLMAVAALAITDWLGRRDDAAGSAKPAAALPVLPALPDTAKPPENSAGQSRPIIGVQTKPAPALAEKPSVQPVATAVEPAEHGLPQAIEPATASTETTNQSPVASMAEMPSEQRQQLPALKLSMHVFSPEAGKRFAIIDGQRVNEGSVLGSAVVEQIRQDGVVLSVQGQTYLLPRP